MTEVNTSKPIEKVSGVEYFCLELRSGKSTGYWPTYEEAAAYLAKQNPSVYRPDRGPFRGVAWEGEPEHRELTEWRQRLYPIYCRELT